ncbi:MAG TPA: MlaD family protein, partial [Chryseolinea sp.]|nr:MlaD family protein [Chryseolinea sp.]
MKLGIFVLAGITLFLVSIFYIGSERNIFNKTFTVSAIFKNVEGLTEGDNVWLSGVKIGTVKNVTIISEGKVVVNLSLKDKQNEFIKQDATAFIGSDGLVGSKIVVVRPGSAAESIHDNDTINSFSPTDTQELINIAKDVGSNTRSLTDDLKLITAKINKGEGVVGELLNEGELSRDLRETIDALRLASRNTNDATMDLKKLVAE